jgi:hypothetical protein
LLDHELDRIVAVVHVTEDPDELPPQTLFTVGELLQADLPT